MTGGVGWWLVENLGAFEGSIIIITECDTLEDRVIGAVQHKSG